MRTIGDAMSNTLKQSCDEGVIRAKSADNPCDSKTERWILFATNLGSRLAFID
jgi:hypothetical protein